MVDDYIARKHRRKKVSYPHPVCESILNTTYGVIVYQEQVMRIAVALSGFTMGEADILRKAMGKKKADVMAQMRQKFVQGAQATSNMDKNLADDLFTQIEKFAGYAFNKSHSAAYAVISYQTAYLKTYYPVEFMAALLSTEMRTQDNVVRYINSARERKIGIAPPCVNRSDRDFSVESGPTDGPEQQRIIFGLGAVKGIGDAAIQAIVEGRQDSPYTSLYDFCERVDIKRVNRKVIEALIKSGACDSLNRPRAQIFSAMDRAIEAGQKAYQDRVMGQTNLFAAFAAAQKDAGADALTAHEAYNTADTWSERERLAYEKDALGFYITGHPLDHYLADLPRLGTVTTATLASQSNRGGRFGSEVAIAGVVSALRERPLKNGSGRMAFVTLEDLHGSCEVLMFSKVFAECEMVLKGPDPILLRGHTMVDGDEDGQGIVKIRATGVERLADARIHRTRAVTVNIPVAQADDAKLRQLKDAIVDNRGSVPVTVCLHAPEKFEATVAVCKTLRVCPNDAFMTRMHTLFGVTSVTLA
jgi:DNA polymerase-3 subunit alpha